MIAVALKGFTTFGRAYKPGDVCQTDTWRNAEQMLRTRLIRAASDDEADRWRKQQKGK